MDISAEFECLTAAEVVRFATGEQVRDGAKEHLRSCDACACAVREACGHEEFLAANAGVVRALASAGTPEIPGYRNLVRTASGGQGVVFRAEHEPTHRIVAIKMLRDGVFASERQRFRFERETDLLAALSHPNIVRVLDKGRTGDGRDFLVMEWVEGLALDVYARRYLAPPECAGRDRVRRVLEVVARIAHATQHAHGGSVIHRDIKPTNILVDERGEPHVIDFGLAREELVPGATITEEFAGTREYASPEQVRGDPEQMRVTTDVYSLGVILYELLTGRFPYPVEGSQSQVDRHILFSEPRSLRGISSDISEEAETIVLKALKKSPADRYATAGGLAADLDDYLAGRPIAAKKDSVWYVVRRAVYRHRRAVSTGVTLGVFALVAVTGAISYRAQQRKLIDARERAIAEVERSGALALVLGAFDSPTAAGQARQLSANMMQLQRRVDFGWLTDQPRMEAETNALLSSIARSSGILSGAEELLRRSLTRRLSEFGEDHPSVARVEHDLAQVLLERGRLKEAEGYSRRSLTVRGRVYGEDSIEAAKSQVLLARILTATARPEEASGHIQRAVEVLEKLGGENGADFAQALHTRATILLAMGEIQSAAADAESAIRLRFAHLPDEDAMVGESLDLLAAIERRRESAQSELVTRLESLSRGLARVRTDREMLPADAAAVLEETLAYKTSLLGPDHRALISTLSAIVTKHEIAKDLQGKRRALARLTPLVETVCGSKSLALANCLEEWGNTYAPSGQHAEAASILAKSIDIWKSIPECDRDNVQMGINQRWLGEFYMLSGQWLNARTTLLEAIGTLTKACGPDHHQIVLAQGELSWVLANLGEMTEAERGAMTALAALERYPYMPFDQNQFVRASAGATLAMCGREREARRALLSVWNDKRYAWKDVPGPFVFRKVLTQGMAKVCQLAGDAQGERDWLAVQPLPGDLVP